jgi:uncharacterized membrane protein
MSNSNFESSKMLAGIGAILMFLGFIPVVGIIGIILVLIGMRGLAEHYRDESISRNVFTGVIFGIIGFIAIAVGGFSVGALFSLGFAGIIGGILGLLVLLVVVFIFFLFMAINFRRALYALADRSGEHLFHTAGTLLFIGAVLTIVFFIGLILIFIAWIIATIGFFSLRAAPQPSYTYTPPPPTTPPAAATTTTGTQYCPHCGAPVSQGAAFCSHCGQKI